MLKREQVLQCEVEIQHEKRRHLHVRKFGYQFPAYIYHIYMPPPYGFLRIYFYKTYTATEVPVVGIKASFYVIRLKHIDSKKPSILYMLVSHMHV